MKRVLLLPLVLPLFLLLAGCDSGMEKQQKAVISTNFGDITIVLFNSTPKHRDNFIKLVNEGFYSDLLFHRVIEGFMIQGGDPGSKNAAPGQPLGAGGPGYEIDAEIGAPHLRGALAAARNTNPEKRSSGSQFYIVTGKPISEQELQGIEKSKNITYNEVQRQRYLETGGAPFLDMDYTVFGEVVTGMDVVDKISKAPRDPRDRPLEDIKFTIKLVK